MSSVVDSSGWIEYFSGGSRASAFEGHLERKSDLIIPTLVIYEVYRWIKKHSGEDVALKCISQMNSPKTIPLTDSIAMHAADLSLEHKLALADSIVYATALTYRAKLITMDQDFRGLPNVSVIDK